MLYRNSKMVKQELKKLIKSLYKMDGYIIQRIALYVKEASIVKLMFYISEYRDLIKTSDYHYDELVLKYSRKNWYTDDLRMIKSLYRLNIQYYNGYNHMDWAAYNGHIEVVKWLHENRKESCTTYAMAWAAANGHLEIIKWLHENRKEGCTTYAMNYAASNGHIEIVKWLHENRKEGCTTHAMNWAASEGHLEIVKWLHYNRTEGCTKLAMKYATENNHLEIVKWLQENIKN